MKLSKNILALVILVLASTAFSQKFEGLALTPPMGWNSWNKFGCNVDEKMIRDMADGMSWAGRTRQPNFPPVPKGQRPYWRDRRTCVLPVSLEAGHFYRVELNPTGRQAFCGEDDRPANQSVLYFTTQGAGEEVRAMLTKPKVVDLIPANGATDVDPNLTELRVTFDLPMWKGYSWTGGGEQYPESGCTNVHWLDEHTCVLPVTLRPNRQYILGINSEVAMNFQSANGGVPADPVVYTFRTRP